MRKLLLNTTPLFRKLRQLTLLLSLLLVPQLAGAADYNLWIGGVRVTDANKDNILAGDATNDGKLIFTPATDTNPTNTLTLRGAEIGSTTTSFEHGITVSNLANLTIICAGETGSYSYSKVYSTGTPIYCTDASCDLTFTSEENDINYIQFNTNATNLVEGFKTVTYVENKAEQFLPQKQIGFITYDILFQNNQNTGSFTLNTKTRTFDRSLLDSSSFAILSGGGFTFDPATCTLTIQDGTKFGRLADVQLQQSAIYTEIRWGVDADLKVVINGDCQIIGGVDGNLTFYPFHNINLKTYQPNADRKISFEKGAGATNANLALVAADSTKAVLIKDFAATDVSLSSDLKWVKGLPVENAASLTTSYNLTVDGTQVTVAAGKDGITAGSGKVYYDGANNIMTLDGVNLNGPIATDIDNMIIELKGENKINAAANNAIKRISSNGTLNLTIRPADSDPLGSINLANTSSNLIDGFNISLGGALFAYPSLNNASTHDSNITSLLVGSQMVTHTGDVFSSHSRVSFNNASNTNVLTLSGVTNELQYSKIISGLSNLTINFDGTNTIVRGDTATVIMSTNSSSVLTFTKATDASSLTISNVPGEHSIIHGFSSITYGDGIYQATSAPATYVNTPDKGLLSALDNTTPISSLSLSSAPTYLLWVAGTQATSATTSGTGWSYDNDNKKLSLNAATLNGSILSGLGDLTIDIQGTNIITVSDTAAVIRSTNAGKLTITKTGATPSLRLQNTFNDSYPIYHCPVIKDFASFELSEGLYLSNAKSDGDFGVPALYESFGNLSSNGGNSTMGLVNAEQSYSWQPRGIRDVTISTDVYYPIWVAHHRENVGNGYNIVYTQITPTNKDDFLGDGVPKVSFIPASASNENINTLKLNEAAITDAIFSNLANLTIEFSGTNTLCDNGKTTGYIHGADPNAIITFKALADNSSISLDCANDHAVVEGFANVAFDKAVAEYTGRFSYDTTERKYKNNYGDLQTLFIKTPTPPTMSYNSQEKVTLEKSYPDGDIYYTITYADGKTTDVAKTKYTAEFAMDAPGTVETWVEANGATTSSVKGKHFGYQEAQFSLLEQEELTPVLIPAIETGDNIDYATAATRYAIDDANVATIDNNGKITALAIGTATLTTQLAYASNLPLTTTILNYDEKFTTQLTVSKVFNLTFAEGANYMIYYNSAHNNLTIPDGMTAAIVTGVSSSGTTVETTTLSYIPATSAVLLGKGTSTGTPTITLFTGTQENTTANKLKYVDNNPVTTTGYEYVLYKDEFVKATGSIPDGKCYLDLTGAAPAPAPARSLGIDSDGTTDIRELRMENEERDEWYDLQGRRIEQPTKAGLYIKNGKKVIVNIK